MANEAGQRLCVTCSGMFPDSVDVCPNDGTKLLAAGDDDSSTCISFVGVSQVMQDWLGKFIFRHHRRSGAHAQVSRWLLWPISLSSVAARYQIHNFLCVEVRLLVQQ